MNLVEIETSIVNLREAKKNMQAHYEQKMKETQASIAVLERQKALKLSDFDTSKIEVAEAILEIKGSQFDVTVVRDAIQDVLQGTPHMATMYFGSKDYDCFSHQRSDHNYFMGPRHGTIVYSIGLKKPYRTGLSKEQQESCVYYLNLLLEPERRVRLVFKQN